MGSNWKKTVNDILKGVDVKQNLALLRKEIKEIKKGSPEWESLLFLIKENDKEFAKLFKSKEPKVRKNMTLLANDIHTFDFIVELYDAYLVEEYRYIRADMIEAICSIGLLIQGQELNEHIDKCYEELELAKNNCQKDDDNESITSPTLVDNTIHIVRELAALVAIRKRFYNVQWNYSGENELSELILVTNRNQKQVLLNKLKQIPRKETNAGVMVKSDSLKDILKLRMVQEFLFVFDNGAQYEDNAVSLASQLIDNGLMEYLDKRHTKKMFKEGPLPYLFRVEAKYPEEDSNQRLQKFIKSFCMELTKKSDFRLINSTSYYDIEIRLIKRNNGKISVLLKLFTIKDDRFSYRTQINATSMRPTNAALAANIASKYLCIDSVRLDPFVGTGTLLIESIKEVPCKIAYGIDISGETLEKAKINFANAKLNVESNFIMKDFANFTHEHLFDEIITEPPALLGKYDQKTLDSIYITLFKKAEKLLKKGGYLIIWSHNRRVCRLMANSEPFTLVKEYEISMVEKVDLFIIRFRAECEKTH